MANEQASLYIDDAAIYALLSRGRQVLKWASSPLESGLVVQGVIQDEDAVAARVAELWRTVGIKTRKVIVGISGIGYLYRTISIPELPKGMLPEAIMREASTTLGISVEDVYISWQIISSVPGELTVYVAALSRNLVDAEVSTLRKAGLDPYLADLKPLCLARTATETTAIMVDVQPGSFDVVILVDNMPEVVRSLSLPLEASLEENLDTITEELDRSVIFYNSAHMDKPIDFSVPISVSGELAEREDMWERISGGQKRPVQLMPLPVAVPEGFPSAGYLTNIGLALKEVLASERGAIAYSLIDFNAVPEVYLPKRRKLADIMFVPTIVGGVALVAIFGFFSAAVYIHNNGLQDEMAAINQKMTAQQVRAEDVIALNQQVASVEAVRDALVADLDAFEDDRDKINGDLAEANSCLPGGMDLGKMSVTKKAGESMGYTLVVEAYADSEKEILRYGEDLRASRVDGQPRFDLVVITLVDSGGGGDHNYKAVITLTKVI
jgi:type IV pilus assembly protein PilM